MADSLSYNSVELAIIYEKEIGRKHIYTPDQTTYLWTEWVFDVRATVNPQVISYIETGAPAKGNLPATTDKVIRSLLNQPRKKLIFVQNGVTVLEAPKGNDPTDVHLGPFVENFNLTRDIGGKTWIVEMRIVARVRECPGVPGRGAGPVLLSNRWTKVMDTDQDYIASIHTFGECVFDSSTLQLFNRAPDDYRIDLLQPIPPNTKRDNINVTAMPDGCTLRYAFTDQERHFNTRPATRIEAYQTEFFAQGSLLSSIIGAVPGFAGDAANLEAGSAVRRAGNVIKQVIPQFYSHLLVRCWGHRDINKNTLLRQALCMAFERVTSLRNTEFSVMRDLNGKWIEVQLTTRTGPERVFDLLPGLSIQATAAIQRIFPDFPPLAVQAVFPNGVLESIFNISSDEESPGLFHLEAGGKWYSQGSFMENVPPPYSGGTRGTLLQKIVAQSLHSPCQVPPKAAAASHVTDRTIY